MRVTRLLERLRALVRDFELAIGPPAHSSFGTVLSGADGARGTVVGRGRITDSPPRRASQGLPSAAPRAVTECLAPGPDEPWPSRIPLSPDLASVAGYVRISEPVAIGDVLVIDRAVPGCMRPGEAAADSAVVGVVSGEPRGNNTLVPATFSGVTLCKVDAGYGPIHTGDMLTVSPTRGHAMLSSFRVPGTILGKALEPLPSGSGRIKVLVSLR